MVPFINIAILLLKFCKEYTGHRKNQVATLEHNSCLIELASLLIFK